MVDFYTKYDQQFEFYSKSSTSVIISLSSKTRKPFTQNKKEVRLYYSINENFAETAKVFGINESTVRGMIKARPVPDNIKLSSKCNFPGTWRPLIFPVELDDEMLTWILALWGLHFSVSVLRFQKKAKLLIQLDNPSFSANCDWVNKFFTQHNLALRARISISQKLIYPFSLVGKMVETPAKTQSKCIAKKGGRVFGSFFRE